MNGLVEGCDGNVHVFNTMALQIVQIAVVGVSYNAEEESWAHRIFKRDIRVQPGADMVEETLKLLKRRSPDEDGRDKPRRVTEMMRRGVMTFMERQVMADALRSPWRIGHGNPLAYELLTGAGSVELIRLSIPVLRRLIEHRKFIFVPSDTKEQHIKTIRDALDPLEYAIITDATPYLARIGRGHFRGEWAQTMEKDLRAFIDEAGPQIVVGTYRASPYAPAQVFYAHRDFAHEAARIAIADSVHLDHRGFPMLIEMADNMCRTYFGAQTVERPVLAAFGGTDAPFRHLGERSNRRLKGSPSWPRKITSFVLKSWTPRPRAQNPQGEVIMSSSDIRSKDAVNPAPVSAAQTLADDAANNGGTFAEDSEYQGAFGCTLFDDRASEDGTVTVVFPPERIGDIPSQSLIRIVSKPDRHEYIASVSAGPFCEPDGLPAQAPQLIVTAVRGHQTLPRHHGRLQATILGEKTPKGIIPARLRPRPNSAVHLVPSADVAAILNLEGDARLGLLNGYDDVEIKVDTKKKSILPRHTAHIGTTGGGKSTGVGRTIFELQKANSCVVVFDVEGEYTALNEENDNAGILEVLEQRGLKPSAVENTHVYRLCGCAAANPKHPSSKEFTLQFEQISPFAFGEIMDLSDAQNERLIQAYEIGKALLRELEIFPPKGGEREVLDIDEFDRGWPMMKLEDLRYLISAIIAIAEKTGEGEPQFRESQFFGRWDNVKAKVHAYFSAGDADGEARKAKISHGVSWKALMARISRLQRLRIFDRGRQFAIKYTKCYSPGASTSSTCPMSRTWMSAIWRLPRCYAAF